VFSSEQHIFQHPLMISSLFILIQTQMALIILRYVIMTIVFCSMTSDATVSRTYNVAMNTTGSKLCAVDQPTTVIPMAASTMTIHCGVKCNEDPSCELFQMKEDLKQYELFTYLPQNFSAIDHCTAYAASPGERRVLSFTQNSSLVLLQRPGLTSMWQHWGGWRATDARKRGRPWCRSISVYPCLQVAQSW